VALRVPKAELPRDAGLLDRLGPAAMVELTGYIAYANLATRANVANGVESQGFSAACDIPPAPRPDGLRA